MTEYHLALLALLFLDASGESYQGKIDLFQRSSSGMVWFTGRIDFQVNDGATDLHVSVEEWRRVASDASLKHVRQHVLIVRDRPELKKVTTIYMDPARKRFTENTSEYGPSMEGMKKWVQTLFADDHAGSTIRFDGSKELQARALRSRQGTALLIQGKESVYTDVHVKAEFDPETAWIRGPVTIDLHMDLATEPAKPSVFEVPTDYQRVKESKTSNGPVSNAQTK